VTRRGEGEGPPPRPPLRGAASAGGFPPRGGFPNVAAQQLRGVPLVISYFFKPSSSSPGKFTSWKGGKLMGLDLLVARGVGSR